MFVCFLIYSLGESVTKQIRSINKEIGDEKEKMKATQQDLQTRISDFKKTLITHQKLMADVGALLRSIGKLHDFFYKLYLPNLIVQRFL